MFDDARALVGSAPPPISIDEFRSRQNRLFSQIGSVSFCCGASVGADSQHRRLGSHLSVSIRPMARKISDPER